MALDVEQLRKTILHTEYETAQEIRNACIENGYSVSVGFAIAYRAGVSTGKRSVKDNQKRLYKDLAEANERIKVLKLSYAHLLQIQHLLAHPQPDRDIEELIAEIDAAYEANRLHSEQADPLSEHIPIDSMQVNAPGAGCKNLMDIIAENDH